MNNPHDFVHLFIRQFWRILKMDYPSVVWKRSMIEWLDNWQFDYQQSKRYNCDKIFIDLANNITALHWPISSITLMLSVKCDQLSLSLKMNRTDCQNVSNCQQGTPGNSWWGCAARFSESWLNFRPKNVIFHTRLQTRPQKSIPIFRPGL